MEVRPTHPVLLPAIFTMAPGATRLTALQIRPIPLTADRLGPVSGYSDPGAWITEILAPALGAARLTSRVHPLLPRMTRSGRLAIPIWATARADGTARHIDAPDALHELAGELGDSRFASHVMATVRAALATEPFAQRIVGDELRMLALKEDRLSTDPMGDRPTVIALLPETFTLNELQQAIAATLGIHADEMESSSNFRRRLQEFVHRGVLQEASAPRDAATTERAGRPPRHYRFDPVGWQRWLHEHRARGSRGARDEGGWSDAAIMNHSPDSPMRRFEHDLAERTRAFAPEPGRTGAPPSTPDADERLARLERMMRAMEKRLDGGDAIP